MIMLIDDDPAVLDTIRECLRPFFAVRIAAAGIKGLELARLNPLPDLVLLDVRLPDMHGYDICQALKEDPLTAEIPVIFLSSHSDAGNVTHGLELGAVDFVSKPVEPAILLARVRTHLRLREAGSLLRDQNHHLELLVKQRTHDLETSTNELEARTLELQASQDLTIVALGSIAETRDNDTGNHIQRTRAYVKAMALRLASLQRYQNSGDDPQWKLIWKTAPLHDLGKVGIPDQILLKPGKLTPEEFEIMKQHPVIGRNALQAAGEKMQLDFPFLAVAKEIAYQHHERWDGKGYPEGIAGTAIPLSARIMAVADVFDALISHRVYRRGLPFPDAINAIREGRGTHFDPDIVDCFLDDIEEFRLIAAEFNDDFTRREQ